MSAETARNIETMILRALAERTQSAVAESADVSATRLSRWKSGEGGMDLREVAAILGALGLQLVATGHSEAVTIPREDYDALRTLARRALS